MADQLLSDPTPAEDTEIEDPTGGPLSEIRPVSPDQESTTTSADLTAFLAGIRPIRRAVTLYARGDLLAEVEVLQAKLSTLGPREHQETLDKIAQLQAEMDASAIDVVVEGRSESWRQDQLEKLRAKGLSDFEIGCALTCAQIVSPPGFTPDVLAQIAAVSPTQSDLIVLAVQLANGQSVGQSNPFRIRPGAGQIQ